MMIKTVKAYKEKDPKDTIFWIRKILSENNIFTIEYLHQRDIKGFYSCSVILANENLFDLRLQSNGKGASIEYAFASAYAEFLERLQNGILNNAFLTKYIYKFHDPRTKILMDYEYRRKLKYNNIEFSHVHSPDETYIPSDIIISDFFPIYKSKYPDTDLANFKQLINSMSKKENVLCLPFYSVLDDSLINIPFDFIDSSFGSNGMCAGNTCHEAIIQGICEIFERYALRTIFYNRLCPPIIDHNYFLGTDILKKINIIQQKYDCRIIIKDCSLGMEIPVIGVIYVENKSRKYLVNFGADPNPIIALERCLTELFQGDFETKLNTFSLNEDLFNSTENNGKIHDEFYKVYTKNSGRWPVEFFLNSLSYEFVDYFGNYNNVSNEKDLKLLINLLEKNNFMLLIRDSSYLNFPTYQIYIPGMSELETKLENRIKGETFESGENSFSFFKLKNMSKAENLNFIRIMKQKKYSYNKENNSLKGLIKFRTHDDVNELSYNLMLFSLSYKNLDFMEALNYLGDFLSGKNTDYSYYYCVRDYIKLKSEGKNDVDITQILSQYYEPSEVNEVVEDLCNPNEILNYYNLPNCFNCGECAINQSCNYFDVLKFESNLQIKKNQYFPNQLDLKKEFNFLNEEVFYD
ncbi:MAG: YcaO-like family protein [Ignavibacteriales bacterium]|nr:YcaO-like family protein [Ignavibacteriales bacterium]